MMPLDLEKVALSSQDLVTLLAETEESFDVAFRNSAEVPTITTGAIAIFLIDGLAEGVKKIEPERERQALLIEEMARCLGYLMIKYAGGTGAEVH